MSDDVDDSTPWTPEGAARLLEAATRVQAAIVAHAQAVVDADGDGEAVLRASDELLPVLVAYADAQFDFTGDGFPLVELEDFVADDDGDEDAEDWPTTGISVHQRHDYVVTDEDALLAAGRQAYLRVWPDDDEAAAAADVTYVGRALYQLAHADGWNSLYRAPGLDAVGGFIGLVRQEDLFGPEPDDWDAAVLPEDADVLFAQTDVYRAP